MTMALQEACRRMALLALCLSAAAVAMGGVRIASVGNAPESVATLEHCRKEMSAVVDDYSTGGGSLLEQTRKACAAGESYRMFILWPSSADVGDVEECVRLVRDFNLRTAAVLFTSSGLTLEQGEAVQRICAAKSVSPLSVAGKEPSFGAGFVRLVLEKDWGIDRDMIKAKGRDRAMARTKRLHDAKWGVFNHYLGYGCRSADEWNARVESFDVVKLGDQLEACGASYYFITLMQCKRWMCAPNAAFDRIAGTMPGEACSRRDLPADIARELSKRGIDLYLYFTGDGPCMDTALAERFGFADPYGAGATRPFVEKWAAVMEEFAVRYGQFVKGWWIDGCYVSEYKYTDDLLSLYAEAARRGNPDALVACNNGVGAVYSRHAATDDYTAGEFNDFFAVPPERFIDGAQAHALIPLAAWGAGHTPAWGGRGLKRTPDYVADYVSLVNANGGVVTIDVHVDPDGTWDPEQFEALKIVGRKTGTLFQPFNHP